MSTKPVPPFAGKVYISGKIDKVHVGMKQVYLSDTVVINAEPPRAKTLNSGFTAPFIRLLTPRLSLQCRIFINIVRFASPLKNDVMTEDIDA